MKIDLDRLLDMSAAEVARMALTALARDEFWLLAGAVTGKIIDTHRELAEKLWEAGHADPADAPAAVTILRAIAEGEAAAGADQKETQTEGET